MLAFMLVPALHMDTDKTIRKKMNRPFMSLILNTFFKIISIAIALSALTSYAEEKFSWPKGYNSALSITFDDARPSQLTHGVPVLDKYGVKGTFYISLFMIKGNDKGWLEISKNGHELGNHSLSHPCSGNFKWTRKQEVEIEEFTLEKMRRDLDISNAQIKTKFGVTPTSFAYPCGHTQVGRGKHTKSYVPLVADAFSSGRLWLTEYQNDPSYVDIYQLAGTPMDQMSFEQLLPLMKQAQKEGRWLIFAGHGIDEGGKYSTPSDTLEKLLQYAQDPKNKIWTDTVTNVTNYIKSNRKTQ